MGAISLRWPSFGKEKKRENETSPRQPAHSFSPIQSNSAAWLEHESDSGIGPEKRQNVPHSLFRWKWEIMGMLLSLASTAASIVLLAVFDGRRVDSFHAPFSLNTFVSILAQASRTSLAFGVGSGLGQAKWNIFTRRHGSLTLFQAFDEASKGPWGSLNLMYHLRSWSLAILGAAVIVTLLTIEPLVQASITQDGILDKDFSNLASKTTITRATNYSVASFNLTESDEDINGPGLELLITAYRGNSSSDSQTALPIFGCPTGNSIYKLPYPNSAGVISVLSGNPFGNDTDGGQGPAYVADVSAYPERTWSFQETGNQTTIVVWSTLQYAIDRASTLSNWNTTAIRATECALSFCTRVYSASVAEGILKETLVASVTHREPDSFQLYNTSTSVPAEIRNSTGFEGDTQYARSDLQLFITDDEARSLNLTSDDGLRFNITQDAVSNTVYSLTNTAYNVRQIQNFVGSAKDLNATFKTLADNISLYLRNEAHNKSGSAHYGTAHKWAFHYRIRWEFLIPPLVLTLAGCFFILYTIWETRSLGLMAWKESTLATLAHGLDALTRAKMRESYLDNTEDKSAREILVKAEKFRGGIELCETYPGVNSKGTSRV
ncbi:hypothetical protein NPX13_g7372 [Xylaria arbuscula]|uniref:Uncharacterized protein n=1 Tax=Xylaria arbuscula TaxID=114810 RepID=A0A9W8NAP0_9PEZI|nr:hypothetical protein NPX13_g7372 [Xylaria arbuscula]